MTVLLLLLIGLTVYLAARLRRLERQVEKLREATVAPPAPEPAAQPAAKETEPEPELAVDLDELDDEPAKPHDPSNHLAMGRRPVDRTERTPTPADHAMRWLKRYFTEGNIIVRVGVIVLFFGVAFLLRYASAQGVLSAELKIAGVSLLGAALLAVGLWLKKRRQLYALILQGAGLGVLYMSAFAGLKLLALWPAPVSFAFLVVLVSAAGALAVWQDARSLAVMAVVGGFLAPVLTASDQGNHIVLFSYYALLNLGILGIAWFRAWRSLNLLGFVFTFVIATAWGVMRYAPADRPSAQLFLILFFAFYLAIGLLYARRQPPRLKGYVDGTLIFGVPLVAFGLQAGLVADLEYGLAWSALVLGLVYGALTGLTRRLGGDAYRLLSEAYLALAVIFFTLTFPFALNGEWFVAAWALEGAGILWISARQGRQLGAAFALGLQALAGLALLSVWEQRGTGPLLVSSGFLGGLALTLSGGLSAHWLRSARTLERLTPMATPMLVWAVGWWLLNGVSEIVTQADWDIERLALLGFFAATAAALGWLEKRLDWPALRATAPGLCVALWLVWLLNVIDGVYLLAEWTWLGWLAALAVLLWLFHRADQWSTPDAHLTRWMHASTLWLTSWLLYDALRHWFAQLPPGWALLASGFAMVAGIMLAVKTPLWPPARHRKTYVTLGAGPLALLLGVWVLLPANLSRGDLMNLPYIPLLNPLDLLQLAALATVALWWQALGQNGHRKLKPGHAYLIWAGAVFAWLNATLLRTLHHGFGVDYTPEGIAHSTLAQACLSIFWTLVGLAGVFVAARRHWREVWLVAAVLLGTVVVKLFILDMADSNTLEAIISFIAVGLLLLVVGYVSPLPPAATQNTDTE